MWASGDDQILSHCYNSAMTKHWQYYLGSGHFDLKNNRNLPGTCWLWCGGVLPQSCLHNLTEVKIRCMNISLLNDEQSEVCFIMQIQSVCLGACVGTCFIPGVWKLIRLISTGSVGWWAIISALLNRLLVPGSESLRLLLRHQWVKWAISTCKQPGRQNPTQYRHIISVATWFE